MTTFLDLRDSIAKSLRDPDKQTFTDVDLKSMVNMGLSEIGRIAPRRFQEDITPVADALEYTVMSSTLAQAGPEIEVTRVELWDGTVTPKRQVARILPASGAYVSDSQTGWKIWDGTLEVPRYVPVYIGASPQNFLIRVWGYCPYVPLSGDGDPSGLSAERESALVSYCRVEGLRRLLAERDLFTQWQAGANNTDVSPASLMNNFSLALQDWNRLARSITVLREAAG